MEATTIILEVIIISAIIIGIVDSCKWSAGMAAALWHRLTVALT